MNPGPVELPVWDVQAGADRAGLWSALISHPGAGEEYFILFRPPPGVGPGGLLNFLASAGIELRFLVPLPAPLRAV